MRPRRYVLTGGGTGGHVTPAIALANELRSRDPEARFLYVGTRTGKEAEIVPKYGFPLTFVQAHQWTFHRPWHTLRFLLKISLGVLKSVGIILRFGPDAVIGTGGYVAAPVVFANLILRTLGLSKAKTIIHEQNITPGRLNALVGRVSDLVLVSFAATQDYFGRAVYVGYPVRREIRPQDQDEAKERLGIPVDAQVVFAFGGSMGARAINRAIIDALPYLRERPNLRVVHGTGRALTSYDPVADCRERLRQVEISPDDLAGWYEPYEFIDRMSDYYAAADLVVARAGAGTLAELCAAGRPALLVPKANLPGDHQVMNALELVRAGAAEIIYEDVRALDGETEESVDGTALARRIAGLLDDAERRSRMAKRAAALATPDALTVTTDLIGALIAEGVVKRDLPGLPTQKPATRVHAELAHLTGERLRARAEHLVAERERTLATPSERFREREDELIRAISDDEVFDYLRYRAAGCLASPSWRVKNAGIKMVGILRQREKLPIILAILNDRTPAPLLHRLLGGDYVQNGFLRRNSVAALATLGVYSPEVRQTLVGCLSDPYFEVRSASARALGDFSDLVAEDDRTVEALMKATYDEKFEVVVEAVHTLGRIAPSKRLAPRLHELTDHEQWPVRQAVIDAYRMLLDRGEPVNVDQVRRDLDEMMVVSTGFVPTFALKTSVGRLGESLRAAESGKREG